MTNLLFSIIIPTYNRADFIVKTINSVLAQSYSNFEILVIDDGSIDNTKNVVEAIKDTRLVYHKKHNGERASARNFGIKKAKGDYISFLDSDDLYYPDYLKNAAESIKKYISPEFVFLAYESVTEKGKRLDVFDFIDNNEWRVMIKGNPMSCLGIVLRKDIFNLYLFNENRALSGSEDWEFLIRVIARYGFKVDKRISAALIRHENNSVVNVKENELIERKLLSYELAFKDDNVKKLFGKHKREILGSIHSYISLHLILAKKKKKGLKYFLKSVTLFPKSIFSRRTLAIFKRLFYK